MVDRVEVFDQNRPLSFSIAYRMMGSVMEALLAVHMAQALCTKVKDRPAPDGCSPASIQSCMASWSR